MPIRTISILVFIFYSFAGIACSCWGPQNFCDVTSNSTYPQDYVFMVKKKYDIDHGMEVEVIKAYRNNVEDKNIMIWGDLGFLCRKYTGGYAIGDTFIFNLHKMGEHTWHPLEQPGDFELSFCGRHYLHVKNGKVIGFINHSNAVQTVDLETFNNFFGNDDCANIQTEAEDLEVIVGPNPFVDRLRIGANQRLNVVELYDMNGRLIFKDNPKGFYYTIKSSKHRLSPGMYMLRLLGYMSDEKIIQIISL